MHNFASTAYPIKTSSLDYLSKIMRVNSAQRLIHRKLSTVNRPYFVPYSLSCVQRAFLVPYFGLGAIADPRRGDLVAGLGDATSERQLLKIKSLLMESSAGRKLMREKPLITESSLQLSSSNFPDDSLGRKYSEFMKVNNLNIFNLSLMISSG